MATKDDPGAFDCYNEAANDEPLFVLIARDQHAPHIVRAWARERRGRLHTEAHRMNGNDVLDVVAKLDEAERCADAMEAWYTEQGLVTDDA